MKKRNKYLTVALLMIVTFFAFGQILRNNFIDFDDYEYITNNNHIKSGFTPETIKWAFTAIVSSNWHPLTLLSHILDWSLFGANASGHHLINLLLHIGSVLFLFFFFNRATKSLWPSAFAAALFSLHPLRVESVAWAAERKDVLSMFFGLATLYAYTLYAEKRRLSKYLLSLLLFALGLLAKPMLVTLPFVLLLLDYWPLQRFQKKLNPQKFPDSVNSTSIKKKDKKRKADSATENRNSLPLKSSGKIWNTLLWDKAPFFLLACASSIVTLWAQSGTVASLQKLPLAERLSNAIISYVSYLAKIFWPVDLAVFYPYDPALPSWQVFGAAFLLLGISIAVLYAFKKAPYLFVGWLWYLGTLVPVIGLVQVGMQSMADRYTYLPSIGIGIMLTWGIPALLKHKKMRIYIVLPLGLTVLAILTILTWQQCGYWKNSMDLFNHTLHVTKNNDVAHYNLAFAFRVQGNIEEAINHSQEALRIKPSYADAHIHLGLIYERYFNNFDKAIYHYRQALQFKPNDPDIYFDMGLALAKKGELKEAIGNFRRAISLKPDYEEARSALKLAVEIERQQKR